MQDMLQLTECIVGASVLYPVLGRIIRRNRLLKDLTSKEVSKAAGVGYSYYCAIERGEHDPTIKTLQKVSGVLGVSAWQLLKEAEVSAE